jgi:hypothetical protein
MARLLDAYYCYDIIIDTLRFHISLRELLRLSFMFIFDAAMPPFAADAFHFAFDAAAATPLLSDAFRHFRHFRHFFA